MKSETRRKDRQREHEAIKRWLASDEAAKLVDIRTINAPDDQQRCLANRIDRALRAGIEIGRDLQADLDRDILVEMVPPPTTT